MSNGYPVKENSVPVKRYCQMLKLKNDSALIEKYRRLHSKEEAWPIIREGIRSVGILEMEMYILENYVFMIVETPLDFDWNTMMDKLAKFPRQQEWEDYVAVFQDCEPGNTSAEKWKMMERMFYLYD